MKSDRMTRTQLTSLFLQSSFEDALLDYRQSFHRKDLPFWDAIIITASNQSQAAGYEKQIEYRRYLGLIPPVSDVVIIPDEGDVRVGSGGSTLSVIRELKRRYGDLNGHRFLCIHAGGASQRCPQYSALGKLFSPIPTMIEGHPATLFDMFLLTMASVPGRMREGMLLLSGDVILLQNPLMLELGSTDAAIITHKETAETGKNHGVCLRDEETGNVREFLHKLPVETLSARGAVDERGNCNIDTGAVYLGVRTLERLYRLVETDEGYHSIVNDRVRLSLYGDINYALSEAATLGSLQLQAPEGEFCEELSLAREQLWNAIGDLTMRCLTLSPAKFTHFGSIPEILRLMDTGVNEYAALGWKKQINSSVADGTVAGYNSVLESGTRIGRGCYLEVSYIHPEAVIGSDCYISFCDLHDEVIPDGLLVHGLKQSDGSFLCRIIGVNDDPKKGVLFGKDLAEAAKRLGICESELWEGQDAHTLWNAKLYPVCGNIRDAVRASLSVHAMITGEERDAVDGWRGRPRRSLRSGFEAADPQAIIDWNMRMGDLVRMDEMKKLILSGKPASLAAEILRSDHLTKIQRQWLESELSGLDTTRLCEFSYAMRLYYYLGAGLRDESYTASCFRLIADTVLRSTLKDLNFRDTARIVQDDVTVRLPLRVNWGGGWSDTCPYCLENGGVVLNAAIRLNGRDPVEVRILRIPERKIVFISNDMDARREFDTIGSLQQAGDPYDPFALQKACLLACGVIPREGGDLGEILDRLGGGFEMHSEVIGVPKGSGLGTSSILSAAAVRAILTFLGIAHDDELVFSTVLAMEQLMSTGGGWQDQVGGLIPGIKLITADPGIAQRLRVEKVKIAEETRKELSERFALIYTGQRRLARNLLRDVVGRYVGNEPDSLTAHREVRRSAALMRVALEQGDVDGFAALLDDHWRLSRMIDEGSTNSLIDWIFLSVDDLIDARMCCGAGGGGFLQVILKKGVTRQDLHERLKEVFQDFAVDVWPAEIVTEN